MTRKAKHITQDELKYFLTYDPDTGVFTWNVDIGRARVGAVAGYVNNQGYLQIGINSRPFLSHRLAFLYMEGYLPEYEVGHIDRDKLNNKWSNLREVTHLCNSLNKHVRKDSSTKIPGVSWHKASGKWIVFITSKRKRIYIGIFVDFNDAVRARWNAEVQYNFLGCNSNSASYLYLRKHKLLKK